MLAGNFLGDIVRRILVNLVTEGLLLSGGVSQRLGSKDSISAADVVAIERFVDRKLNCSHTLTLTLAPTGRERRRCESCWDACPTKESACRRTT